MTDDSTFPAKYPGVFVAYDFVIPSYGWMLARVEAAESRIHILQVFAVSLTFAAPAAAKSLDPAISFTAGRFVIAMVAFVGLMVLGMWGRVDGAVKVADPSKLREQWLHLSEWEFKKNAVWWAGDHFATNRRLVEKKWWIAVWMLGAFLVELLFLFAWFVTA